MADTVVVMDDKAGQSVAGGAAWLMLAITAAGLGLSIFLFGLATWITIKYAVVAAAVLLRTENPVAAYTAAFGTLGLDFAVYLFGWWVWPSVVIGIIAIMGIASHFSSRGGSETASGDQNPIYTIAMIIAVRAFIATVYSSVNPFTDTPGFLSWITIFVIGIIPDVPVIVNVLLSIVLNGTLIIYLVLLAKRIANPLAN